MKKLICLFAAVAAMTATMTSYAATYEAIGTAENAVSTDKAAGMKTVLIYEGDDTTELTDSDIVYVGQTDTAFTAETKFLIKSSAAAKEGLYTVKLGGSGTTPITDTFYIGVMGAGYSGDVEMENVGNKATADGKYNIGYKATVTGEYKSVIIKKSDDTYMGCSITTLTGDGSAQIGIQINGVESPTDISNVYISKRTITVNEDNNTTATADATK